MVAGNHEQQEAWHGTTAADDLPIMGKNAEKKFFLNPVPNSFYSGDSRTHQPAERRPPRPGLLLLDVGRCALRGGHPRTGRRPPSPTPPVRAAARAIRPAPATAGTGRSEPTQFNWLKTTLANSDAKYKFVFAHQIVGGNSMTPTRSTTDTAASTPPTSWSGAATTSTAPPTRGAPTGHLRLGQPAHPRR